ncbi:MAG: Glutamyl-tRNA(Gln) amidotransferase subunit A [Candidatus Azambacteria bacterium GW2011_GWA2_42_9]|uniref:Glutamyl-tRNA(Gln) amidotransferase subunit A n=3 Tax=Candidatus Azamiibacteriota TaxID=1752741 RepID=A0A0G1C7T8_9BACT|nr:MAG: Glutamyl-tRNA(Gln) amidotransferase subunit A [Candidatus Azambacteria bacterium GW2011_GWB1_42_17]KKS45693.1 MAG: Glutamyl-tRNA(Gln) amidotransferase subunit A [Candidatus Azambacteria bacterium GW2011_GWA1_42_19]KKS74952.1 MAG: Glutamyl-tRNA(Gln) amidotransferase subunit A [Candidatus Azambacteria bacterium GW2011_GWA2_42_9]KKS87997.1 MAG: aspartyl/glutamyl-tRNA amidotransferase subunit A, aspartyl-tRNA(Asn)/glutamyl-tRNA (Gln) amidotransferase subunit A [Parcubacteria group bacterium 
MNLKELTIKQAHELLEKREITFLELTQGFLSEIKKKDKDIHAFLSLSEDEALEAAKKVDDRIAKGEQIEMLAGIPAAVKDNILIRGGKTTAASKILENYIAPYDATVIKKLKEEETVFIGKTNLDEFAMGSSTENSGFGPTKNPVDLERVPGGSSGGSAAAVKAGFCVYALGSDTGGSIRQPASFCGVVGFKPTYGAVSRHGLIAMASSLDQIGPITKTVEDAAIIFEAIRGKDELDSTSVHRDWGDFTKPLDIEELKIGVPREYFTHGLDPEIEKNIKSVISKLEKEGAKIVEISLPHSDWALATYYIIMPAEVSANLTRFDGIKYGYSEISRPTGDHPKGEKLLDIYLKTRQEGFGAEVRRRIMLGTYILSAGYYDAYYKRAQKVRRLIKKDFDFAFENIDVILTPTTPSTAFKFGEKTSDPLSMYLADIYTVSVNLAGVPAISLPSGEVGGLPVGLQLIGKNFDDIKLLQIAKTVETIIKEKNHT